MPVSKGGDDDLRFEKFDVRENGVATHRRASRYPRLQISYFTKNPSLGEVDIDFDTGCVWGDMCHCRPSNSDVGSYKGRHRHLDDFNFSFRFFTTLLTAAWNDTRHHCERAY